MEAYYNNLLFLIELFKNCANVYYYEFDPSFSIKSKTSEDEDFLFRIGMLVKSKDFEIVKKHVEEKQVNPLIIYNSIGMSWIVINEIIQDVVCRIHIIGPVLNDVVSKDTIFNNDDIKAIPLDKQAKILELIENIPVLQQLAWIQYGSMLYYTVNGKQTSFGDFIFDSYEKEDSKQYGEKEKNTPTDITWMLEQELMSKIESGSLNYKETYVKIAESAGSRSLYPGLPQIRQIKDSIISNITLSTRAAIRGGLSPEIAYRLGINYITSIELAKNPSELVNLNNMMFKDFVTRVNSLKNNNIDSRIIQDCKDYIDYHIAEKITLESLANKFYYSETYLTKKFKKEIGESISIYIQNKKIEESKKLLRQTNKSVQEVANELNFCNASYFINLFKKKYGITPQDYKNQKNA